MSGGSPHCVTVSLPCSPGAGATGVSVWVLHTLAGQGGAWGGGSGYLIGTGFAVLQVTAQSLRLAGGLVHLGSGKPQAPLTFSPCGLDWGWNLRPGVLCPAKRMSCPPGRLPTLLHPWGLQGGCVGVGVEGSWTSAGALTTGS